MILNAVPMRYRMVPFVVVVLLGLLVYYVGPSFLLVTASPCAAIAADRDRPQDLFYTPSPSQWGVSHKVPGALVSSEPVDLSETIQPLDTQNDGTTAVDVTKPLFIGAEEPKSGSSTTRLSDHSSELDDALHDVSSSPYPSSFSSSKGSPTQGNTKVVMVTASSGTGGMLGIPGLKEMVYENRKTYALQHGYDLMWANISSYNLPNDVPVYWNKIPVLQEAFTRYPDADWIWWMDMDMIIMNSSLSLWDHVLSPEAMRRNVLLDSPLRMPGGKESGYRTPSSYDYDHVNFMISSGGWGMNVGNFLMKRSEWSDWLLDLWTEPLYIEQRWTFPENDGWTHMWRHHPIVRKHTVCTNQRALNAYPAYNSLGDHWQPGDHSIHFAGCGSHERCPSEWLKYWELREAVEVPYSVKKALEDGTADIENIQRGVGLVAAR